MLESIEDTELFIDTETGEIVDAKEVILALIIEEKIRRKFKWKSCGHC